VSGEGASAYFATNDSATTEQHGMRQSTANWPEEFTIPAFDHDIEMILSRGNTDYISCRKRTDLSRSTIVSSHLNSWKSQLPHSNKRILFRCIKRIAGASRQL